MLAPSRIMRTTESRAGGMRHRDALVEKARTSIKEGSKSFAAASMLFDRTTRERVWLLYAWCRRCDDIADNQDMGRTIEGALGDQSKAADRLKSIKVLTRRAFEGLPTADVAFDAFGLVAQECGITPEMADDVIAGFALDAKDWRPRGEGDLMQYCYHVAGAVGVMMAKVMGVPADDEETLNQACDLGLAFQLANIARDLVEDDAAGRCYLPMEWLAEEDIEPGQHTKPHHRTELADMANRLILIMDTHAKSARLGAAKLPFRSRWAILSAARIYSEIGYEVRSKRETAWDSRVYTSKTAKLRHVSAAFFEALANNPRGPDEMPRWTRSQLAEKARI